MATGQKRKKGLLQTGEIRMNDLKYLSYQYIWGSFFDQQKAMEMFDFHPPGESKIFKGLIVSYSLFLKYIEIETDMYGGVEVRSPILLTNTMLSNLLERAHITAYQLFGKEDIWQFKPSFAASQPVYEMAHVTVNGQCCYCAIYRRQNLKPGQVKLRVGVETFDDGIHEIPKIILASTDASIAQIEESLKDHHNEAKELWNVPSDPNDPWIDYDDNGEEVIRLELGGNEIEVALERSYPRKTITLYCGKNGLRLRAPLKYPIGKLLRFVGSKRKWITGALTRIQEKAELSSEWEKKIFEDHEFPWLGAYKKFEIVEKGSDMPLSEGIDFQIEVPAGSLDDRQAIIKGLLYSLGPECYKQFMDKIQSKVEEIGDTGRPFTFLRLSSALTRWGTCKANGTIFLNWRLIMMDEEFLNYVICHELAHLKVMRHDKAFWSTVEAYCPNYKKVEKRMKKYSLRNFPF